MTVALLLLLGLVSGLLLLLWWGQERILFQPPILFDVREQTGRVEYRATDGQQLVGYVVGDPKTSVGLLLCFHGNADLAVWQLDWARSVHERTGYAVFLAEYRGYMSLGGTPSYATTRLDADAAYDHARKSLGVDSARLAYFGHSLGSAVAAELAERHPPRALLLQSPFSSARAMARLIVSAPVVMAWKTVSRIHFDTRQIVSRLDVPVSVAHGKRDRVVPLKLGLEVYEAAKKKGGLLLVEDAGHNDVAEVAGEEYWEWVQKGLDPHKSIKKDQ
ncbi:MAG TPA: alpha/beta hydrolase [Gemmatimonadaceae bacterium]|nr:alpha/beta hydrolase [Gemmatimonadaceae bacterium]